jgi:hypothetical protein
MKVAAGLTQAVDPYDCPAFVSDDTASHARLRMYEDHERDGRVYSPCHERWGSGYWVSKHAEKMLLLGRNRRSEVVWLDRRMVDA